MSDETTPDLREKIAEALTTEHHRRAKARIAASPEEHSAAMADAAMAVVQPELDRLAERIPYREGETEEQYLERQVARWRSEAWQARGKLWEAEAMIAIVRKAIKDERAVARQIVDEGRDQGGAWANLMHSCAMFLMALNSEDQPTIHSCPPGGSGLMPCCGQTPFTVPGARLTIDPDAVTCSVQAEEPT
jgi:hypothetical protein